MVRIGRTRKLRRAIIAKNVDTTWNSAGTITHETQIKYRIGEQGFKEWFMIMKLGDQKLILGIPWLWEHNPKMDWDKSTIELVDWSSLGGRSLNEMTQYINALRLCIGISPPLGEYQGMVQTTREPPGRVDKWNS
jgi:hypothetical protein